MAASSRTPAYTLDQFTIDRELGAGSFGVVKRSVHQETGEVFAMKVLEKEKVVQRELQEQLKREVLTQLRVKHANVVRLHYYFEDEVKIYCLLEFADGGQLFAYLRDFGVNLPESRAARFFTDTASGLAYLHGLRVVHRDMKPENILLFGHALRAKIGDFGWCVELTDEVSQRRTFCGTLDYLAPEMLNNELHDATLDLWALGVLLYEMIVARSPFAGGSQKQTMDRICAVRFEVLPGSMSKGAEQLVRGLLVKKGSARTPLSEVLRHPWVVGNCSGADSGDSLDATRAAPLRGTSGHASGSSAAGAISGGGDSGLDATRCVPRQRPGAAEATTKPGPSDTRARLEIPPDTAASAATGGGSAKASTGLDQTCVVPRHRQVAAAAAAAPAALGKGGASSNSARAGQAEALSPPSGFVPPSSSSATGGNPRHAGEDSLLSDATDRKIKPMELADLDGRFLAAPTRGKESSAASGYPTSRSPEADLNNTASGFWIVRTEQVTSCVAPRPKVRSQRPSRASRMTNDS